MQGEDPSQLLKPDSDRISLTCREHMLVLIFVEVVLLILCESAMSVICNVKIPPQVTYYLLLNFEVLWY